MFTAIVSSKGDLKFARWTAENILLTAIGHFFLIQFVIQILQYCSCHNFTQFPGHYSKATTCSSYPFIYSPYAWISGVMQPHCALFTLSKVTSTVVSAWYGTDSRNTLKIRWQWILLSHTHWVTLLHDGLLHKERWEGINDKWHYPLTWSVSCITHSLSQIHVLYAWATSHRWCSSPTQVTPIPRFPIQTEGQ